MRSASSSQRECVLAVANEVQLSTRRGKAESKELPFVSTFLFFSGEEGGTTYEASPFPLPSPLQPHCTLGVATWLCSTSKASRV